MENKLTGPIQAQTPGDVFLREDHLWQSQRRPVQIRTGPKLNEKSKQTCLGLLVMSNNVDCCSQEKTSPVLQGEENHVFQGAKTRILNCLEVSSIADWCPKNVWA